MERVPTDVQQRQSAFVPIMTADGTDDHMIKPHGAGRTTRSKVSTRVATAMMTSMM